MGEQDTEPELSDERVRNVTAALLRDVEALRRALDAGLFETGVHRIGAEQEIVLVDEAMNPAPVATDVLDAVDDPSVVPEIARFNVEINLAPRLLTGCGLSEMEAELVAALARVDAAAARSGARPFLCGILPTIRTADLTLANMMPRPRYRALNDAVRKLRGGVFRCHIKGVDEIDVTSDSVMLEAVNTSFQVHYQVSPQEFAKVYNAAQLIAAPVLAAAVNSPVLLNRRLWAETRVAVFQHSIDSRTTGQQVRGHRPRVDFGDRWVRNSVLEIFQEDISRFRVVLACDPDEDPIALVDRGVAPQLRALRLFNGTVYRWNRPCYGVVDGVAHLRIEARALPAGPTVLDEMANAAFFTGLLAGVSDEYGDVSALIPFDDARANFLAASRFGLDAQLRWPGIGTVPAAVLIGEHLLPLARAGLRGRGVVEADVDRYLGTIGERVRSGRTGSAWALASMHALTAAGVPREQQGRALTASALEQQRTGRPVHEWESASAQPGDDFRSSYRTVGQFMTTDLRTVHRGDLVDLVAALMDWGHVRHIPVEDEEGRIVGVVSHRAIVRLVANSAGRPLAPLTVESIMKRDPATVTPDTPTLDAIRVMRERKVGCLPVIEAGRLVGIVTEQDFIVIAQWLLEERLA